MASSPWRLARASATPHIDAVGTIAKASTGFVEGVAFTMRENEAEGPRLRKPALRE